MRGVAQNLLDLKWYIFKVMMLIKAEKSPLLRIGLSTIFPGAFRESRKVPGACPGASRSVPETVPAAAAAGCGRCPRGAARVQAPSREIHIYLDIPHAQNTRTTIIQYRKIQIPRIPQIKNP